jgi:hypothetical protein
MEDLIIMGPPGSVGVTNFGADGDTARHRRFPLVGNWVADDTTLMVAIVNSPFRATSFAGDSPTNET